MHSYRMSFIAALATVLISAASLYAGSLAELLPQDTDLRIHIPSADRLRSSISDSQFGRAWSDPAIQDFLGHPNPGAWLWPDFSATGPARDEILHLHQEQIKLLRGEVLYGLRDDAEDNLYFAANMNAADHGVMLEMDRRIAALAPEPITFTRDEFQGIEMLRTTHVTETKTNIGWQALVNDTLLASSDRTWMEKNIARLTATPPHAGTPDYLLQIRLNGKWINDKLMKHLAATSVIPKNPENPQAQPPFKPADLIAALKISELQTLDITLEGTPDHLQAGLRVNNNRSRQGIWTLIDTTPLPADPGVPFVPADIHNYSADRLDLASFWNALPGILEQINPIFPMSLQFFQGMLKDTFDLDLHNDIFRHIDSAYVNCSRLQDGRTQNLLYWRLKDPDAVTAVIQRLLTDTAPLRMQLGDKFRPEDFRGFTLNIFTTAGNESGEWGLTVAGAYLIIGDTEMLRSALRAIDSPAAPPAFFNTQLYRVLQRAKPAGTFAHSVFNLPVFIRDYLTGPEWQKMRSHWTKWQERKSSRDSKWPGLDFDRLPPPEKIAAGFGPLVSYSTATTDGFETKIIFIEPEK